MSVDDIFSVAIDANGSIVKISPDGDDIEHFITYSGRNDLNHMSFCSMSEYYEHLYDHNMVIAIR